MFGSRRTVSRRGEASCQAAGPQRTRGLNPSTGGSVSAAQAVALSVSDVAGCDKWRMRVKWTAVIVAVATE